MSLIPATVPTDWQPADFPRVDSDSASDVFRDLTLADRCDSCSAAAKAQVVVNADSDPMLFCGHHFLQHKSAFDAAGMEYRLDDEDFALPFTIGSASKNNKARDAGSV